ncbi:hypothetical protein C8R44DRAFT_558774, partial [Mycena epipterygia]
WSSSVYKGIVPAKNIGRENSAMGQWRNGNEILPMLPNHNLIFLQLTTNGRYWFEVTAHWISSYFLRNKMKLPKTPEEASAHTKRDAIWPQHTDELLEDIYSPSMRSGATWFTWPFQVVRAGHIA